MCFSRTTAASAAMQCEEEMKVQKISKAEFKRRFAVGTELIRTYHWRGDKLSSLVNEHLVVDRQQTQAIVLRNDGGQTGWIYLKNYTQVLANDDGEVEVHMDGVDGPAIRYQIVRAA